MTLTDYAHWKSDEFGYCARLVNWRGDDNVGYKPTTIASYLELQSASARCDGEDAIADRLKLAAMHVRAENWIAAERAFGF